VLVRVLVLLLVLLAPRIASACGAAYPGGPIMCDNPRAELWRRNERGPIARMSASYAYTSTTLLFGGDRRANLVRHAVFGGIEIPLASRLSLEIAAGGIAGGELTHGTSSDAIGPGFAGAVGMGWRVLGETETRPWILLTGTISGTHMLTKTVVNGREETPRFTAFDLRIGGVVGKTMFDVLTPYVLARVFGGPAYWHFDGEAVTGTDLHKYQFGGGLALALFDHRLDVFAEGVPLGEVGLVLGAGTTFF
jgi:hypothetical protein